MDKIINKRFDEVFDLSLGRTPSRGVDSYWNGTHTWVSIADMSCGKYISESKERITDKALIETNIPIVKKGTVIMSFKLSIGKVCITNADLYTNEAIMAFTPKDNYKINPEFLYYYLSFYKWNNSNEVVLGFTLNKKTISQSIVSIPPLAEQQRIVEILDREFEKIDALKDNAERNLQYVKDLYAKLTDHILTPQEGWSTSNLKSICKKIGSGATPSGGKQSYTDKGIHLIRSMNVHNNCFRYNELAHINDVQAKQLDNVTIERGDVLFNITGASVTRCCLVPVDVIPARVNQHVSILRVDDNIILPKYLVYTLISSRYNIPLMQMAEDGATRQAITKKQLEDFNISYPNTIKEQLNIISFLDKLSEQCKALGENYTKTIALCDDMKQALLRQAFNGEL